MIFLLFLGEKRHSLEAKLGPGFNYFKRKSKNHQSTHQWILQNLQKIKVDLFAPPPRMPLMIIESYFLIKYAHPPMYCQRFAYIHFFKYICIHIVITKSSNFLSDTRLIKLLGHCFYPYSMSMSSIVVCVCVCVCVRACNCRLPGKILCF